MQKIIFIMLMAGLMLCCQSRQPQNCDLTDFDEIKSKTIEYQHIRVFDNRFNSTFTYDTSYVTLFKLEDDKVGFQILNKGYEWFYNSIELIGLNHSDKTKTVEIPEAVTDISLWDKNLLGMLDTLSKKKCVLTSMANAFYQHYSDRVVTRSSVDSNKTLVNEMEYVFPESGHDHFSYREIIIRGSDTLQIQNHFFKNINFQSKKTYGLIKENVVNNTYKILKDDESLPFGKAPVQEGDQLAKNEFSDIEGNTIRIGSKEKKYSLIVFSFIGCSPCEIALNQLKEDKFGLRNKVNLYYSSFQNNNNSVKKYLEHKKIFRNAFAMESNMIQEFRLPVSPTFVLIDANNKIRKIIEGFDDSVLMTLHVAIKSR